MKYLWKSKRTGEEIEYEGKNNCNHCYGRGYTSRDVLKDEYILCRCLKPVPKVEVKSNELVEEAS